MKSITPLVDYSPLSSELNPTKQLRYGTYSTTKAGDLEIDKEGNLGVIIDGYTVVSRV